MKKLFHMIFGRSLCPSKNIFQPFPFSGGFEKKEITDDGKRAPLSREKIMRLRNMVLETAKLFDNSNLTWAIDGGLSISLLRGDFIGEHRDLDVAVEKSELKRLQSIVEEKGFGLFVTLGAKSRDTMIMKRVGWKEYSQADTFLFWIIAVDENGLIMKDRDLSFINVHIVKRNKQGLPLGIENAILPLHWFEPQSINFQGIKINVANPIKTAYYKLQSLRNYDITDLRHMFESGLIDCADFEEIGHVLENEAGDKQVKAYYIARRRFLEKMKKWS